MRVQHVPLELVNQVWPKVVKYIDDAVIQQSGEPDFTLDQVRTYVTSGTWMLAVVVDAEGAINGAMTINFFNRPNDRVAFITYIGGKHIVSKESFDQLATLCKSFGATKIEGAVNEAVARLWRRFGFTEKYRIAGVTL